MLKPKCSDFILATARMIRRKPKKFPSGPSATAGIGLHRIFDVVKRLYSEQEFRTSLDSLLKEQSIIIVAYVHTEKGGKYSGGSRELVETIPKSLSGHYENWFVNTKGKPVKHEQSKSGMLFNHVRLYIIADGLPNGVARLCDRGDTIVQKILKSMKKK